MPVLLTIKRELCNRWLCINYASINSKLQIPLPHWTTSENLNYRRSVRWTIHLSGPKSCSHAQRKDQIWWSILLFYCKRQNQRPWLSIHRLSFNTQTLWTFSSEPFARKGEVFALKHLHVERFRLKFPTPWAQTTVKCSGRGGRGCWSFVLISVIFDFPFLLGGVSIPWRPLPWPC